MLRIYEQLKLEANIIVVLSAAIIYTYFFCYGYFVNNMLDGCLILTNCKVKRDMLFYGFPYYCKKSSSLFALWPICKRKFLNSWPWKLFKKLKLKGEIKKLSSKCFFGSRKSEWNPIFVFKEKNKKYFFSLFIWRTINRKRRRRDFFFMKNSSYLSKRNNVHIFGFYLFTSWQK